MPIKLPIEKLESFKEFLKGKGYLIEETTKSPYELFRLRSISSKRLVIVYQRDNKGYATIQKQDVNLYIEFQDSEYFDKQPIEIIKVPVSEIKDCIKLLKQSGINSKVVVANKLEQILAA